MSCNDLLVENKKDLNHKMLRKLILALERLDDVVQRLEKLENYIRKDSKDMWCMINTICERLDLEKEDGED